MPRPLKDFDAWNAKKQQLQIRNPAVIHIREREVWFCSIGLNVGFEEDGKNSEFERPVVIFKKFNNQLFWGIPLTTQLKPHNRYYTPFKQGADQYAALISHLRLYDSRRLQRRLYVMEKAAFTQLISAIAVIVDSVSKKSDPAERGPRGPKRPFCIGSAQILGSLNGHCSCMLDE